MPDRAVRSASARRQAAPGRGLGDHRDRGLGAEQALGDHLAGPAGAPECQGVALALRGPGHHLHQPDKETLVWNSNDRRRLRLRLRAEFLKEPRRPRGRRCVRDHRKGRRRPPYDVPAIGAGIDAQRDLRHGAGHRVVVLEQEVEPAGARLVHPGAREAAAVIPPPHPRLVVLGVEVEHVKAGDTAGRYTDQCAGPARPPFGDKGVAAACILEAVLGVRRLILFAWEDTDAPGGEAECGL